MRVSTNIATMLELFQIIVASLTVLYLWNVVYGFINPGCSIDVNRDLYSPNQPVLLKKQGLKYELALPTVKRSDGLVELKINEELVLACPGKNNHLKEENINNQTIYSTCFRQTYVQLHDKRYVNIHNAQCKYPPEANIQHIPTTCASGGNLYEIGFQVEGWHTLIKSCYNVRKAQTYYATHNIIGASLKGARRSTSRPMFKIGNLKDLIKGIPSDIYTKRSQKKMFESVFGKKASDYFTDNSQYLTRGHLAPNADFLFGSWQFATFFYINAAPQWRSINVGNWQSVERVVRKLAIQLQRNLEVITGTHNILKLEDSRRALREIYLHENILPVPRFFWKIVYDADTKEGIAFIGSNNPYLKNERDEMKFCRDICATEHWVNKDTVLRFMNVTGGYTVCCTVQELQKEIPSIPPLSITGILKGPY